MNPSIYPKTLVCSAYTGLRLEIQRVNVHLVTPANDVKYQFAKTSASTATAASTVEASPIASKCENFIKLQHDLL